MPNRINPFIYSRSVQPDEFVGREPELRRLFSRLATGQSTAIIGLPHVGKSSLLNYVMDPARRKDPLWRRIRPRHVPNSRCADAAFGEKPDRVLGAGPGRGGSRVEPGRRQIAGAIQAGLRNGEGKQVWHFCAGTVVYRSQCQGCALHAVPGRIRRPALAPGAEQRRVLRQPALVGVAFARSGAGARLAAGCGAVEHPDPGDQPARIALFQRFHPDHAENPDRARLS